VSARKGESEGGRERSDGVGWDENGVARGGGRESHGNRDERRAGREGRKEG
jgi:hypothetical protein